MANTTSLIPNTVPNPAVSVTVLLSNDDISATGVVELELFITIGGNSTPIAHQLFAVPPLVTFIRTFNLFGAAAFEVQYNVTGTTNLKINVFPTDVGGNMVAAQRVLNDETQGISLLTPVP
jgi:hypothetical protein